MAQDTIERVMLKIRALRKPLVSKPGTILAQSKTIAALMTRENNPSVRTVMGKCIDEPKYYCNNHGYIPRIDCDAGHDPCYYEHGDGLDDKFLNHIGYEFVLWLLTRDTHANRRVIYSTKIDKDRRKPKLQNIKYVSISTMKVYLSDSTEIAVKDSHK